MYLMDSCGSKSGKRLTFDRNALYPEYNDLRNTTWDIVCRYDWEESESPVARG